MNYQSAGAKIFFYIYTYMYAGGDYPYIRITCTGAHWGQSCIKYLYLPTGPIVARYFYYVCCNHVVKCTIVVTV